MRQAEKPGDEDTQGRGVGDIFEATDGPIETWWRRRPGSNEVEGWVALWWQSCIFLCSV